MNNDRLKFRAWDIESPAMLSWDEIQDQWISEGYHPAIFNNDGYHIMQFTGLYDCNGVEIYEGDIVHDPDSDIDNYFLGSVKFSDSGRWVVSDADGWLEDLCEWVGSLKVIGNVHQHEHLLDGRIED